MSAYFLAIFDLRCCVLHFICCCTLRSLAVLKPISTDTKEVGVEVEFISDEPQEQRVQTMAVRLDPIYKL